MDSRKRINLSVTANEFDKLLVLSKRGGFRSVCDFCKTAMLALIDASQATTKPDADVGISEEVRQMFAGFTDAESPRYGERTRRKRNNKIQ